MAQVHECYNSGRQLSKLFQCLELFDHFLVTCDCDIWSIELWNFGRVSVRQSSWLIYNFTLISWANVCRLIIITFKINLRQMFDLLSYFENMIQFWIEMFISAFQLMLTHSFRLNVRVRRNFIILDRMIQQLFNYLGFFRFSTFSQSFSTPL